MKIYFAGAAAIKEREKIWQSHQNNKLLSYHYIKQCLFVADYAFELIKQGKHK